MNSPLKSSSLTKPILFAVLFKLISCKHPSSIVSLAFDVDRKYTCFNQKQKAVKLEQRYYIVCTKLGQNSQKYLSYKPFINFQLYPWSESTAVWAGNEKLICFNVKTDLTFFTKTIPYITLLVIYRVLIMTK